MQPCFEDEKGNAMHCLERGVKMSGTVVFCTVVFNHLGVEALLTITRIVEGRGKLYLLIIIHLCIALLQFGKHLCSSVLALLKPNVRHIPVVYLHTHHQS